MFVKKIRGLKGEIKGYMFRTILKKIIPSGLWSLFEKWKIRKRALNDSKYKDQSVKEVMGLIYKDNLWGGKEHDFYSGVGSHTVSIVAPYVQHVRAWLDSHERKLVVCDLGCGDFNVGSQLVEHTAAYVGADIVDELVRRNRNLFRKDNLEFKCVDIVNDDLPMADCALVRQVLQHLSNTEIGKALEKLKKYKYLIVTEHVPSGKFTPNVDKSSSPDTRVYKKSGIVLTEHPFNLKPVIEKEILRVDFKKNRSEIVTTLYQLF